MKTTKANTVHTSRTIMFTELSKVMNLSIGKDNYAESMANNVFGKKSLDGIKKTSGFLTQIYKLDIASDAFKAFKYFWINSEESDKVLLSFIFALNNDYLLKESIPTVSKCLIGSKLEIEKIEENIEKYHPNRFTKNTLRSISQNIASSCKQAGFLVGKIKNIRTEPVISYRVVAFAMLLAYLDGLRGDFIFQNDGVLSLCLPENRTREFALEASKRDLMTYQCAGSVTSIGFDDLLTKIRLNAI